MVAVYTATIRIRQGKCDMAILWLGDSACHDPRVTGGKAAALSQLAAKFPVPPGFCLSAAALSTILSPCLAAEIAAAYSELGRRCGVAVPVVAVRSSALGEDGPEASFAGQFESYLNISGTEEVLSAIRCCQESARAERVLIYRQQQGLEVGAQPMSVLIQALVAADASAVVFSADPRTGDRERIVITATWGLGESLVGGTVTPDTWIVRKTDLRIMEESIAEKALMTVAVPGGTREVVTPRFLRDQPSLTPSQIADLARLALDLEQIAGHPVDLECAYAGDRLSLLQCRPITTNLASPAPHNP